MNEIAIQPDAVPAGARGGFGLLARRIWHGARGRVVKLQDAGMWFNLRAAGFRNVAAIKTFTTPQELRALYTLAMLAPPGARALEIGSYLGASTCYLGAGLARRGGTLVCVDTWQNQTMPDGERDTFSEFQANTAPVRERLTLIRKPTQDLVSAELGGPFHLAFIDGDHSYDAVRRDFELVSPCLTANGILAFHDVLYHAGVTRLVGELMASCSWLPMGLVNNLIWLRRSRV